MKVELKVDGVVVGEKVVRNVNFRNGADVNAGLSAGASQIGQAIMDIGSQNKLSEAGAGGVALAGRMAATGTTTAGAANAGALARMVNPLGAVITGLLPTKMGDGTFSGAEREGLITGQLMEDLAGLKDRLSTDDAKRLESDLVGIRGKPSGPNGVQYALIAETSGSYACYSCASGVMELKAGDVWKYGQTLNPDSRYTTASLEIGLAGGPLRQINQFMGSQQQILIIEKIKIYSYLAEHGHLPPGNRIRR